MSTTSTPVSRTLDVLGLLQRKQATTACASCQNAIWHTVKATDDRPQTLRIFCQLMNVLVDSDLDNCDGQTLPSASP